MRRNFTPDQTLVDQLLLNNTNAFEELFHRYWYSLYTYCFGKLKSHDDAKRIVRSVFVSLWEQRNHLPVTFSLSAYLYAEVRKDVVKCVNAKMESEPDETFIEKQIMPGFTTRELYKARKPVSYKGVYPKPGRLHLSEIDNAPNKENWWDKYSSRTNLKGLKTALQTMLNF
ncbi:MAG: hypothetical protein WDO19_24900 [Bacteroidota bacterium]